MRGVLAGLLFLAAIWQAWVDWQATIGEGFAYRLTPIEGVLARYFPETTAGFLNAWRAGGFLWDPVGATLMGLPLALVLAALAAILWFTRRKRR